MQPFKFILSNNGTVTGLYSIPSKSVRTIEYCPLIIGLHGGTYDSQYFDATPEVSASLASVAFGVPFIALDRPCYGETSSILPILKDSDFPQETGRWLHHHILPKLWSEIGIPNRCNCIVLLCHSLGVMGGIVAAALHAQDKTPLYPLGGLIASGMGNTSSSFVKTSSTPSFVPVDVNHIMFPVDVKDKIMFKPGTVSSEALEQSECLNVISPLPEIAEYATDWLPVWKQKWAAHVTTPVMFSLVDNDPFFVSTQQEIDTCVRAFKNSTRVDGSLVKGAPHCMELSFWSQGWYARCFGFAMECACTFNNSR